MEVVELENVRNAVVEKVNSLNNNILEEEHE